MIRALGVGLFALLALAGAALAQEANVTLTPRESETAIQAIEQLAPSARSGRPIPWGRPDAAIAGTIYFSPPHASGAGVYSVCDNCAAPCREFEVRRRQPEPWIAYFGLVCREGANAPWKVGALRGVFRVVSRRQAAERVNPHAPPVPATSQ